MTASNSKRPNVKKTRIIKRKPQRKTMTPQATQGTPKRQGLTRPRSESDPVSKGESNGLRQHLEIFFEWLPANSFIQLLALKRDGGQVFGWYDDSRKLEMDIMELDRSKEYKGIYISLNRVKSDYEPKWLNEYGRSCGGNYAEINMDRYGHILIDVDTERENEVPATREELKAAERKTRAIEKWLEGNGLPPASTFVMTGNGYQIQYRCDLGKDEGKEAILQLLRGLDKKFSDNRARVDTAVSNIARSARVAGTANRKGEGTLERPHRRSKLLACNRNVPPITLPQLLKTIKVLKGKASQSEKRNKPIRKMERSLAEPSTSVNHDAAIEECRSVVLALPEAITKKRGHDKTFSAACVCFEYGLNMEEASDVLRDYNEHRCKPKWSEKELKHKLKNALKRVQDKDNVGSKLQDSPAKASRRITVKYRQGEITQAATEILLVLRDRNIYRFMEKLWQRASDQFRELNPERLVAIINRNISLELHAGESTTRIDCNPKISKECSAIADQMLPIIQEISTTPVVKSDGTVIYKEGYDANSKIFVDWKCPGDFSPIPRYPTVNDAKKALNFLRGLVCDFPFQSEVDRIGWVALVLSHVIRRRFPGPWPMFACIADSSGIGKSLLSKVACSIGTLQPTSSAKDRKNDSAELEKRIESIANGGNAYVYIDNIVEGTVVDSAYLASLITDEEYGYRRLHTQHVASKPNDMYIVLTGNNVSLSAELSRRAIVIRLKNKKRKSNFKKRDLELTVNDRKLEYHRHAMILAVWCLQNAQNSDSDDLQDFVIPSFLKFSRIIVEPLHRLSGKSLRAQVDRHEIEESHDGLEIIQQFCKECFGASRFKSKDVYEALFSNSRPHVSKRSRELFKSLLPAYARDPVQIGSFLSKHVGRVHAGYMLECEKISKSNSYRLAKFRRNA